MRGVTGIGIRYTVSQSWTAWQLAALLALLLAALALSPSHAQKPASSPSRPHRATRQTRHDLRPHRQLVAEADLTALPPTEKFAVQSPLAHQFVNKT